MAMFILTIFEILLFEGRLVLWPAQQVAGRKKIEFSVKNQRKKCLAFVWIAWKVIVLQA